MRLHGVDLAAAAALGLAFFGTGCGPDCRQSCERLYGSGTDQCDINASGYDGEAGAQELISDCTNTCEQAMTESGTAETYDPNSKQGSSERIEITNEAEAAEWMDCIELTSCENIKEGYCQPHKTALE
jgi:hypothetical protein